MLKSLTQMDNKESYKAIEVAADSKYKGVTLRVSPEANKLQEIFIEGALSKEAKQYWQQGMFTYFDVIRLLQKYRLDLSQGLTPSIGDTTTEWFEENKK